MTTTYTVLADYGSDRHVVSEQPTLAEAQAAMRTIANDYAAEDGGDVRIDDRRAWVEVEGDAIALFTITARADDPLAADADDAADHNRLIVAHVLSLLVSECALAEVDDYRGEAVRFLAAVRAYADGAAATPAEAVRQAYGIGARR